MTDQLNVGDKVTAEVTGTVETFNRYTKTVHLRLETGQVVVIPMYAAVNLVTHRDEPPVLSPKEATNEDPRGRYTLEADGTSGEEPLVVLRLTDGDSSTLEIRPDDLAELVRLMVDTMLYARAGHEATRPDDTKEHSDVPPDDL